MVLLFAQAWIVDLYTGALKDFLTRKNSALNLKFFEDFISFCPGLSWRLVPVLAELSTSAASTHLRNNALELLLASTRAKPQLHTDILTNSAESIVTALASHITGECDSKQPPKGSGTPSEEGAAILASAQSGSFLSEDMTASRRKLYANRVRLGLRAATHLANMATKLQLSKVHS